MTATKTCNRCGEILPLDEFRDHTGRAPRDGKHSWCRQCERDTSKERHIPVERSPRPNYLVTPAGPWTRDANCRGVDPDLFFPPRGASTRQAKAVCQGCTVRLQCLEYSLANKEAQGVWGGLSERERRRIRIQRNAARRVAS